MNPAEISRLQANSCEMGEKGVVSPYAIMFGNRTGANDAGDFSCARLKGPPIPGPQTHSQREQPGSASRGTGRGKIIHRL